MEERESVCTSQEGIGQGRSQLNNVRQSTFNYYRPLIVLENISVGFEEVIDDQLDD